MFKSNKHLYEKGTLDYAIENASEFTHNEPNIKWCIIRLWTPPYPYMVSMYNCCIKFWPDSIVLPVEGSFND